MDVEVLTTATTVLFLVERICVTHSLHIGAERWNFVVPMPSEADYFAQPRPAPTFGQWGAAARSAHAWIRQCSCASLNHLELNKWHYYVSVRTGCGQYIEMWFNTDICTSSVNYETVLLQLSEWSSAFSVIEIMWNISWCVHAYNLLLLCILSQSCLKLLLPLLVI